MREIMQEVLYNIEWAVVAVVLLAFVGCSLILVSLVVAIIYENAWLLLILFPAGVCISLAVGIKASGY